MSVFQKLFGSGKPAAPRDSTEQIAATVQKIQGVVELLEKKTEHLQKKIDKELIAAKVNNIFFPRKIAFNTSDTCREK